MNSYYHAKSSARKWGGSWEEYHSIHAFLDSSKEILGDVRHRALYHHTAGCFVVEKIFGPVIVISTGAHVPTRLIAERHIIEDLGWLPSPTDYLKHINIADGAWMGGHPDKVGIPEHIEIPYHEKNKSTKRCDSQDKASDGEACCG